jgi:hypothetical protein
MDRNCSRIKSTLAVFGCSLLASTAAQAAAQIWEREINGKGGLLGRPSSACLPAPASEPVPSNSSITTTRPTPRQWLLS